MTASVVAPDSVAAAGSRRFTLTPVTAVIIAATLLALALRLFQFSRPGYLLGVTEYDDGPYFGSALRLIHGLVPYRDFQVIQPPGITLLMLPAALLSKVTSTDSALVVGRILTTLAGTASVVLVGRLVRHRGVTATVLACGITAVFPDAIAAAHTVLVEPWLVLFCLLGANAVFDGDRLTASPRRLAWAGAAFGFAGAVETWAIFPVIGLLILLLRRPRNAGVFAAGMTAGFGIPVLPFALMAPRGLYDSIVVAQTRVHPIRVPLVAAHPPFPGEVGYSRLLDMTGLSGLSGLSLGGPVQVLVEVFILLIIFGALVAVSVKSHEGPAALDWFAVAAFALISVAFVLPPQFYYHFSAFLAPFLAMAIALPVARLIDATWPAGSSAGQLSPVVAGALILIMGFMQASHEINLHSRMPWSDVVTARRLILPGACLVTDQVSYSIVFDRFTSAVPGCPVMLDPSGINYTMTHGHDPQTGANRYPAVVAFWRDNFSDAQYVWLSYQAYRRIPWTAALHAYFTHTFTQILSDPAGALYRHTSTRLLRYNGIAATRPHHSRGDYLQASLARLPRAGPMTPE